MIKIEGQQLKQKAVRYLKVESICLNHWTKHGYCYKS